MEKQHVGELVKQGQSLPFKRGLNLLCENYYGTGTFLQCFELPSKSTYKTTVIKHS